MEHEDHSTANAHFQRVGEKDGIADKGKGVGRYICGAGAVLVLTGAGPPFILRDTCS